MGSFPETCNDPEIVKKKNTLPISSHLDRTSFVNKRFVIWPTWEIPSG